MFDSKRIKELEKKVELILDHLGLEYQPRLVEKIDMPWKEPEREVADINVDDLVAVKNAEIETLKEICPFYHKDMNVKKVIKKEGAAQDKTVKIKRVCKSCGKKFSTKVNSHRVYCKECKKIKRKETQKKSSRKYTEKKKALTNELNNI